MKKFFVRKMLIWIPLLIFEIVALSIIMIILIQYMLNKESISEFDIGWLIVLNMFFGLLIFITCYKIVKSIKQQKKCKSEVFYVMLSYERKRWASHIRLMVYKTLNPNFCQEIFTGKLLQIGKLNTSKEADRLGRDFRFRWLTVDERVESSNLIERYIKWVSSKEFLFLDKKFSSFELFLDWYLTDVNTVRKEVFLLRKNEQQKIKHILKKTKK